MSRLIYADKLIEQLTNTINEWIKDMPDGEYLKGNVNFSVFARDMIKEQPTAFDVDEVLKQLQSYKDDIRQWNDTYTSGQISAYERAITVIKAGGIDE